MEEEEYFKWSIISCISVYTGYIIHKYPTYIRHILGIQKINENVFKEGCIKIMKEITSRKHPDFFKDTSLKLYNNMMKHLEKLCELCNDHILEVITIIKKNDDKDYSYLLLFLQLLEDKEWNEKYQNILDSRQPTIVIINIPCNHLVIGNQKTCCICGNIVTNSINTFTLTIYTNITYIGYLFKIFDKYIEYLKN